MQCPHCEEENLASARFCSGCGHHLGIAVPAPERGPLVLMATCHRCGETLPPDTYFSRALNIAKLVALLPIGTFVLPLLFFFLRKDRLVCGNCRKLLPASASTALLPAMREAGGHTALMRVEHTQALTLTSAEATQIDKASRAAKSRGVLLAMFAMPLSLPVFAFFGSLGWPQLALIGLPSGLLITGSVKAFRRSNLLHRRAREAQSKDARRQILALAHRYQGRVSVSHVAAALRLDFKEAELLLDAMVDGRHVDVEVTEEGRLVYVFPDLARS